MISEQTSASQSQQAATPADTKKDQAKKLPRSVRWRLSLGLLTTPTHDCNEKDKLYKSIEELNALKLRFQRSRYNDLEKKHYWKSTPLGIADENNTNEGNKGDMDNSSHTMDSLHQVAPGDDPLSSMLDKKGKADDKKGLFGGNGIFGSRKSRDPLASSFNSANSSNDDGEAACKGSRWADFYSTREVLNVIEKDLDRLPSDHYTIFHEWRLKNRGWKEHREREDEWKKRQQEREEADLDQSVTNTDGSLKGTVSSVDVMRMARQQQDEARALSQSSAAENNLKQSWKQSFLVKKRTKSVDNLSALLEEDMEINEEEEKARQEEKAKVDTEASIKERAENLSQLLFVYAKVHPEIGYRQGMHEILSYVLLALEMDILERTLANERKRWRRSSLSFGIGKPADGTDDSEGATAGVDLTGNMVLVRLIDPDHVLHDAFAIFECLMTSLAPAYDAIPADDEVAAAMLEEAKSERGESPMEMMTSSIVSKIRFVARDEQLYGHVLYMPVPPQLYFAKWIRLMFGREVSGGMKGVMSLWDAFFELASFLSNDEMTVTMALLDVLKAAACAMILLIRPKLMAPSMAPNGMMTGEPDPNIGIGYLMNYPTLEDIRPLVKTISELLMKEKKLVKGYQVAKDRMLDKQFLPSENYQVTSSNMEHPLQMNGNYQYQADMQSSALSEDACRNSGQHNGFSENLNGGLPQVFRTGSSQSLQKHDVAHDVAESLGHIAGGLIDFGSKTATAAIASIQKAAFDHPLQNSDVRESRSDEDYVVRYRPKPKHSVHEGDKISEADYVPQEEDDDLPDADIVSKVIDSAEKENPSDSDSDDFNGSISSRLSASNKAAETIQKSPKELATMLEKSVSTLMRHFNDRLSSEESISENDPMSTSQHSIIPDDIWDAMAEIDSVRKELLSQAALTDLGRSSNSLRSSANLGRQGGRNRGRPSWNL